MCVSMFCRRAKTKMYIFTLVMNLLLKKHTDEMCVCVTPLNNGWHINQPGYIK